MSWLEEVMVSEQEEAQLECESIEDISRPVPFFNTTLEFLKRVGLSIKEERKQFVVYKGSLPIKRLLNYAECVAWIDGYQTAHNTWLEWYTLIKS